MNPEEAMAIFDETKDPDERFEMARTMAKWCRINDKTYYYNHGHKDESHFWMTIFDETKDPEEKSESAKNLAKWCRVNNSTCYYNHGHRDEEYWQQYV